MGAPGRWGGPQVTLDKTIQEQLTYKRKAQVPTPECDQVNAILGVRTMSCSDMTSGSGGHAVNHTVAAAGCI